MGTQEEETGVTQVKEMLWVSCCASLAYQDGGCGLRGDAGGMRHGRSKVESGLAEVVAFGARAQRSSNTGEVEENHG